MKVSITFDKDIKQSNKKLWVKEIQTVVDKLNNKHDRESTQINNRSPSVNTHTKTTSNEPTTKAIPGFSHQRESSEQSNSNFNLIEELAGMQKMMEEKFSGITRCIGKLSEKVMNVEKRLVILEIKEEERECCDKDFDREFAEIALKYEKMNVNKKEKESCFNDVETCDTGFSFVRF